MSAIFPRTINKFLLFCLWFYFIKNDERLVIFLVDTRHCRLSSETITFVYMIVMREDVKADSLYLRIIEMWFIVTPNDKIPYSSFSERFLRSHDSIFTLRIFCKN